MSSRLASSGGGNAASAFDRTVESFFGVQAQGLDIFVFSLRFCFFNRRIVPPYEMLTARVSRRCQKGWRAGRRIRSDCLKKTKDLGPLYSNGLGCGVLSLEGGRVGIGNEADRLLVFSKRQPAAHSLLGKTFCPADDGPWCPQPLSGFEPLRHENTDRSVPHYAGSAP
ncbi:hypothetical protein H206_05374 [Candidatus Electrothrix aarhusensis]|uniref:Uncharacterized protein n=1 Tax=Candidatus Electrothrix aarhusensis TaxID=1859131 RepID=A0A444J4S3_9BACT|nr:hypothetical protein H206_05374 [Candidatus Electrothrix aarhusensis]